MAHGCFTVVSCSWLIFLILIQGIVCTSNKKTKRKVDVEMNRDGVVRTIIDGEKGYCCWSDYEPYNWKVMNVICRQLQHGPPEWIYRGLERQPLQYHWPYYWYFGDDTFKPNGNRRRLKWALNTTYYVFTCNGNEISLSECYSYLYTDSYPYTAGGRFDRYSYITGKCLPATSQDFKIHLMKKNKYDVSFPQGTIVTYVNESWGPICTMYQNLSSTVCPMLGKDIVHREKNETHNKLQYSYDDPVVIVRKCNGKEANLSQCDIETTFSTTNSCHASSYAYVECEKTYPPRVPDKEGLTEEKLLGILGIIPILILFCSAICIKKASRVRTGKYDDDDDDSEIIDPSTMTVDEARLRTVRKFF